MYFSLFLKEFLESSEGDFENKLITVMEKIPSAYTIVILTSTNTVVTGSH